MAFMNQIYFVLIHKIHNIKMNSLQIFYWTHLLYIFYWILLILHAPNFWKWFVVPAILFVIEKFFRFSKSVSQEGKTWVTMGVVLPSKVVSLVIRRPPHFAFKPGKSFYPAGMI